MCVLSGDSSHKQQVWEGRPLVGQVQMGLLILLVGDEGSVSLEMETRVVLDSLEEVKGKEICVWEMLDQDEGKGRQISIGKKKEKVEVINLKSLHWCKVCRCP